jgi:glyoxylase-like metal-dependent hydrolase (beta-lactamase superfamily II)
VRWVFEGRVVFCASEEQKAPGLSVHHIGGHTMGLQVVRVRTRRGWVVLASDASHYYANIESGRPFPIVSNVIEMLDGYDRIRRLASSTAHIIPGHDPLVMARYPSARA